MLVPGVMHDDDTTTIVTAITDTAPHPLPTSTHSIICLEGPQRPHVVLILCVMHDDDTITTIPWQQGTWEQPEL